MQDFFEELTWRGLIHNSTPGIEEHLRSGMVTGYIGFDPTAPSLTIGNYVQIMILKFLQLCGHRPVVLMGGATGRIGDPSGKDKERDLKSYDELDRNLMHQVEQMKQLLDFTEGKPNSAILVNNLDFYRDMGAIEFLRDVGKYLTVNYMLAKDSVQNRIESGISFTEFSYQLIQGYDFVLLHDRYGVTLQMGGSDQWGNITSGTELGRKIKDLKLYALTTPLLTKANGEKFGKSSEGNIWLDAKLTSVYKFYQFWINCDDADLPKFFRYFSLKGRAEIEELEQTYSKQPQKLKAIFAEEITTRLHGKEACQAAIESSSIIFDQKLSAESLSLMPKERLDAVAGDLPVYRLSLAELRTGIQLLALLTEKTTIYSSKTEARNAIKNQALAVNKIKITQPESTISEQHLLAGKYILVEAGKKNKHLIIGE